MGNYKGMGSLFDELFGTSVKTQSFNSKEYTRLRDIAQKRIKRAAAQGLAPVVHIPTVREIKAGVTEASAAFRELKNFISGGSTVTAIKQTGMIPEFRKFPELPPRQKLTIEERKARKRELNRLYRMRKQIVKNSISEAQSKTHIGYLKALQTITDQYKKKGRDLGIDLSRMSPTEAAAFTAYMDYRFSQGDFTQMYVIDEFIQGFSKAVKQGHSANDIVNDFNIFLAHQNTVKDRADNMEGITASQFSELWRSFVGE